jgi:hypothetical protein
MMTATTGAGQQTASPSGHGDSVASASLDHLLHQGVQNGAQPPPSPSSSFSSVIAPTEVLTPPPQGAENSAEGQQGRVVAEVESAAAPSASARAAGQSGTCTPLGPLHSDNGSPQIKAQQRPVSSAGAATAAGMQRQAASSHTGQVAGQQQPVTASATSSQAVQVQQRPAQPRCVAVWPGARSSSHPMAAAASPTLGSVQVRR